MLDQLRCCGSSVSSQNLVLLFRKKSSRGFGSDPYYPYLDNSWTSSSAATSNLSKSRVRRSTLSCNEKPCSGMRLSKPLRLGLHTLEGRLRSRAVGFSLRKQGLRLSEIVGGRLESRFFAVQCPRSRRSLASCSLSDLVSSDPAC